MSIESRSIPLSGLRESQLSSGTPLAAPVKNWWCEIGDINSIISKQQALDVLAKNTAEPNVFYEPWMLLPALQTYVIEKRPTFIFVYRRDSQSIQLCGFFPLERSRTTKGIPVASLRTWNPPYTELCTPLVHRDWTREALHHLFDWVQNEGRVGLVDFAKVHGEGPFHHALLDVLRERRLLSYVEECYTRALIRRGPDAETYCAASMNHLSRKEWRRQRRRLGEQGNLETRILGADGNVKTWIEQFLDLEASGWKGKQRSALSMCEADGNFFRTIANAAHARGQLHMLGIFLDDRPIALKCNFLTGDGGFMFKIAFDESFAKYSPGVLLELDNIDEVHRKPGLQWLDSCAIPGHFMINRLWKEHRVIQRVLVATGRWSGNCVVGLLPMLRALKRMRIS